MRPRPCATAMPERNTHVVPVPIRPGASLASVGGARRWPMSVGAAGQSRIALQRFPAIRRSLAMPDDGGAEGNRTPDLLIANEALSQLSYSPIAGHATPLAGRAAPLMVGASIEVKQSWGSLPRRKGLKYVPGRRQSQDVPAMP
jgi:hypothetical protein